MLSKNTWASACPHLRAFLQSFKTHAQGCGIPEGREGGLLPALLKPDSGFWKAASPLPRHSHPHVGSTSKPFIVSLGNIPSNPASSGAPLPPSPLIPSQTFFSRNNSQG